MQFLVDNIFLVLAATVSGGMLLWPLISQNLSTKPVNTLAATQMINSRNAILLDVRDEKEQARGMVPQARSMPAEQLKAHVAEIVKESQSGKEPKPVILMCASGWRSGPLGRTLKKAGVQEVFSLEGGFDAWKQAGLPVKQKALS
ncbi:MAG: rhodanese-like domain-containing protein [Betaproteobacteria bacterium]|nr:rhodanese-like domain-containing protein [Betaproteobacteria bacterium]NBY13302.1 rhodanese-like domain-containing protein [Betaproteobacteria bacterium]NCA16838.1 rhodanese-like domain-containing protein [Betaproteobacteria bacterium]